VAILNLRNEPCDEIIPFLGKHFLECPECRRAVIELLTMPKVQLVILALDGDARKIVVNLTEQLKEREAHHGDTE
jgi:hypothetical protein